MDIAFRYTADAVKKAFVEQGQSLPREGRVEVDLEELAAKTRQALLDLGKVEFGEEGLVGTAGMNPSKRYVALTFVRYGGYTEDVRHVEVSSAPEGPKDIDRLVAQCARVEDELLSDLRAKAKAHAYEALKQARETLEKVRAKPKERTHHEAAAFARSLLHSFDNRYAALVPQQLKDERDVLEAEARALWGEIERQRRAAHAAQEAEERARKEALLAERKAWIEEHGSQFLREAVAAGYDCKRRYIEERAAKEHPNYVADLGDDAVWRSRSCPSPEGLAEAKRVGGTVVWLTEHPYDEADGSEDPEDLEGEAVLIENFRGTGVDLVGVNY